MTKMSFFLGACAVALVVGCGSSPSSPDDESASSEEAVSSNACQTHCAKCPPNQVCTMMCTLKGNCGTSCTETMLCIQGYVWDSKACQCVPQ